MTKDSIFTGITVRESDTRQPYRVWYKGKIIWFAKTDKEAREHLK